MSLTICCLASLYVVVVEPAVSGLHERWQDARSFDERTEKYRAAAQRIPQYRQRLQALERSESNSVGAHFQQPTAALALAELQRKVKLFASSHGAVLVATQTVNADQLKREGDVVLAIHLRGAMGAIVPVLHALERSVPPLRTSNLNITASASGRAHRPTAERGRAPGVQLDVHVTVAAPWRPRT